MSTQDHRRPSPDHAPANRPRIAPLSEEIARRIREHRQALGLSQDEFAQRLDVTRQTVSNWERARTIPDALALMRIAQACGTTADALIGDEAPRVRDRAISARRELALALGIVLALQAAAMLANGIALSTTQATTHGSFAALRLGALIVGGLWIWGIARREGLSTIRQMVDFASLAARVPGSPGDRALRFIGRWFWTLWFVVAGALYGIGAIVGIVQGASDARALLGPALMLLIAAIPYTWERHAAAA